MRNLRGEEMEKAAAQRKKTIFRIIVGFGIILWVGATAIILDGYAKFSYQKGFDKGFEAGATQSKELASSLEFMLKRDQGKNKIDTLAKQ